MGSEFDYTFEERDRDVNAGLYQKFYIETPIGDMEFTIGAEETEVIEVQAQMVDPAGDPMGVEYVLNFQCTSDATGETPAAPSGITIAATTGTILGNYPGYAANASFQVITDETGLAVFTFTDASTGTLTMYLACALPNGAFVVSDAITFENP